MRMLTVVVFALAAVLALPIQAPPAGASSGGRAQDEIVWDGDVFLNETVSILSNQTLVVRPGTTVHIRGIVASCTEGNLPILEINGSLRAEGTPGRPISFVSGEDLPGCAGREAMVIYTRDQNITSVLSNVRFSGGNLLLDGISASIRDCQFNWTFIDIGGDRSAIENCSFVDSPVYFHTASRTVISNCSFGRTEQDEIGIHATSGISIVGSRISGCVFGVEATVGTSAQMRQDVITGCMEGVHSMGNLDISGCSFSCNTVGLNSTAGLDEIRGNVIAGNDVGLVTGGDPMSFMCNTFASGGGPNRLADIQQKILVQGDIVDGNGLALRGSASIFDSAGNRLFDGEPSYVILTRYEMFPNGTQRTYAPFTANASVLGDFAAAVFDGFSRANFTLRLEHLLPQLTVSVTGGPAGDARPGQEVYINATVRNIGNVAAGRFEVEFFVDGRSALSRPVWGLAPGGGTNITFRWIASEGQHRFRVTADARAAQGAGNATGEVRETDEGDNSVSILADIREPPGLPSITFGLMMLIVIVAAAAALAIGRKRG